MGRSTKQTARGGYSLLLKDSVIYGGGRALQKFLVALLLPLYTAFLSRGDYGILGMVVAVTTFLDVFVTLGFDVAFSRFYFDDKTREARRKVITNVFYVSTIYPLLLLGVLAVFMPQIAPLLLGDQYSPGDWIYFDVALATLFFSNLNDVPFTLFRLEHRPWRFSAYTVGRIFIQVPLSVVFVAVFDWGPMGVLLANLVTAAGMQVSLLPTYIGKVDWRLHRRLMKGMLAFAIPALFTGISFYWLKLSDRFFLLHYQGKAEVGLYTVANSLAQPLYLVLMAFRMAWPQWHYAKLDDPEQHRHMVARSSTYFMALNGLALVLMGTYLPLLVHTFLNHRYWSVGPTTFVLALSIAMYALYFVFWVGANVAKKNRHDPGLLRHRQHRQHRPQLLARPRLRHVGRRLDDRGGLRHPCDHGVLLLPALVSHPLRVGAADQGAGRQRADARRGLGDRTPHRAERGHAVRPARRAHPAGHAGATRLPRRPVGHRLLHAGRTAAARRSLAPVARPAAGAPTGRGRRRRRGPQWRRHARRRA